MSATNFSCPLDSERLTITQEGRNNNIYRITMHRLPENRLSKAYIQELIGAFNWIEERLGKGSEGAVITSSAAGLSKSGDGAARYWSTGVEVDTADGSSHPDPNDLFPILHTILRFPFPTIAEITGHTFGGGCVVALCHDYRVMNSERGYISMPAVDLGLYFDGIGLIQYLKLKPKVARKMMLEGHRFSGKEVYDDDVVDVLAAPKELDAAALAVAEKWAPKAKTGVYGLLRSEVLYGPISEQLKTSQAKL